MSNHDRPPGSPHAIRFGPYCLEPDERRLTRSGDVLSLQPKAMDLLICLARQPGVLMTRDQLMSEVWPDVVVTDASLARSVRQVREVLGDDATRPRYVETVPKAGYRFIAPRSEAHTDRATPASLTSARTLALAAFLLTAGGIAALWLGVGSDPLPSVVPPAVPEHSPAPSLDVTSINAQRFFRLGEQALAMRSSASYREARAQFERALEEDPGYADAMAGLALTLGLSSGRPPSREIQRRVAALAERALSIDPDQALAHVALGNLHMYFPSRYDQAERAFRRALNLDPRLVEAYSGLSTVVQSQGRIQEATELKQRALSINPNHTTLTGNLALGLGAMGRYEEALELVGSLEEIPEARPALVYPRIVILYLMGDVAGAAEILLSAAEERSLFAFRRLVGQLIDIGDIDHARAMVAKMDRIGETCETVEAKFFREAPFRIALGGEAMVWIQDHQDLLPLFSNQETALVWQGRLAVRDGDPIRAEKAFRALFPEPGDVVAWQGSLIEPADAAQDLAWALIQLDRTDEAEGYLRRVEEQIELRWSSGYRNHHPLTLLQARNAALMGDLERALELLNRALEYGWLNVNWAGDPRWGQLQDLPGMRAVRERMLDRAQAVRDQLQQREFYRRLSAALDAIPDDFEPNCPDPN